MKRDGVVWDIALRFAELSQGTEAGGTATASAGNAFTSQALRARSSGCGSGGNVRCIPRPHAEPAATLPDLSFPGLDVFRDEGQPARREDHALHQFHADCAGVGGTDTSADANHRGVERGGANVLARQAEGEAGPTPVQSVVPD